MPMALPFARIFTFLEGTSEIQRMIIGRAVTGVSTAARGLPGAGKVSLTWVRAK